MHQFRQQAGKHRVPFWLPATNYYLFSVGVSAALFFLLWGILYDGLDEVPWIISGIVSGLVLCSAVFIREVLLRSARQRFISAKKLDRSVRQIAIRKAVKQNPSKLTLERNEMILREIKKKSEAATVLGRFAEAHREVIKLCEEYLSVAANELANAGPGSPRIPAIRKGSDVASDRHRYHTLQWAEIEARSLTHEANSRDKVSDKLANAERALGVVDHALKSYPKESALVDSQMVLRDYLTSIRVTNSIEKAERASFKGNHKRALSCYNDALFDLKRFKSDNIEMEMMSDKIESEIAKIMKLLDVEPADRHISKLGGQQ